MQIKKGLVAEIDYKLTDDENVVIDSSEGREPLPFLCGANNIIPGLEEELLGKSVGDSLNVTVEPKKGYGEIIPEAVQKAPRSAFETIPDLAVGMQLQADTEQGPVPIIVTEITDTEVTVDGNHPLAGKTLHFAVTVKNIREATEEELEHGHVHTEKSS